MESFTLGPNPTAVVKRVFIQDASKTDGGGLTGLTYASTGLSISTIKSAESVVVNYLQTANNIEDIATLGTYVVPTTNKCRFKEVDATYMPGVYELQFADVRFASTSILKVCISGAAALNIVTKVFEFDCQLKQANTTQMGGTVLTARDIGANVLLSSGTGTGQVALNSGILDVNATKVGGSTITGLDIVTVAGGKIAATVASGDDADAAAVKALLGTPMGASVSADIATVLSAVQGQGPVATVPTAGSSLPTGVVVSGTYADTATPNGTCWIVRGTGAVAASMELIFVTGSITNKANKVDIYGYCSVANPVGTKATEADAWNYTTAAYEQISNSVQGLQNYHMAGQNGTVITHYSYILNVQHIDPTSGNAKIRLRCTDVATTSQIAVDYAPYYYQSGGNTLSDISHAVWSEGVYVKYNGVITLDTNSGFAGRDLGTNGLPTHPSSTLADAVYLASVLGTRQINARTSSSFVLDQTYAGWLFGGWEYYVDLNGQTLTDTAFAFAHIQGTGVCAGNTDMHFSNCYIASTGNAASTASICMATVRNSILVGQITLASGNNIFIDCSDGTNSLTTPIIILADSAEAQFRNYSGGIEFRNIAVGNDLLIDGTGRVVIHSNCTGGKLTIRGAFGKPLNELGAVYSGTVTVVQTERLSTDQPMLLTAVYDSAKTAASHSDITALNNLSSAQAQAASAAAITAASLATASAVSAIPTNPLRAADVLDGTETVASALKKLLASQLGDSDLLNTTDIAYKDQAGAVLYTVAINDTTRRRV